MKFQLITLWFTICLSVEFIGFAYLRVHSIDSDHHVWGYVKPVVMSGNINVLEYRVTSSPEEKVLLAHNIINHSSNKFTIRWGPRNSLTKLEAHISQFSFSNEPISDLNEGQENLRAFICVSNEGPESSSGKKGFKLLVLDVADLKSKTFLQLKKEYNLYEVSFVPVSAERSIFMKAAHEYRREKYGIEGVSIDDYMGDRLPFQPMKMSNMEKFQQNAVKNTLLDDEPQGNLDNEDAQAGLTYALQALRIGMKKGIERRASGQQEAFNGNILAHILFHMKRAILYFDSQRKEAHTMMTEGQTPFLTFAQWRSAIGTPSLSDRAQVSERAPPTGKQRSSRRFFRSRAADEQEKRTSNADSSPVIPTTERPPLYGLPLETFYDELSWLFDGLHLAMQKYASQPQNSPYNDYDRLPNE